MLRNAKLTEHDLSDGLKLLILQDGRFWPASLHSTQLPDVYGLVMEKQRGNRPQIQPRDDILDQGVRFYYYFLKVSLQGVDSFWGDCTFIPADWGS